MTGTRTRRLQRGARPLTLAIAATAVAFAVAAGPLPRVGERLWRRVVAGGAANAITGANTVLDGTVGQVVVGEAGGPENGVRYGYWQPGSTIIGAPDVGAMPVRTRLLQNAPNPFNPVTTIRFELAEAGRARLRVYDLRGRVVTDLVDRQLPAGRHRVDFEPSELASGVYVYELQHGATREVRRLTLVK